MGDYISKEFNDEINKLNDKLALAIDEFKRSINVANKAELENRLNSVK